MTKEQIDQLISEGEFPEGTKKREFVETHISWVILCDDFVYKIKKPVDYSFLNFSTQELRKHFCEREIILNRRLTPDVYLGVFPVRASNGKINIGGTTGSVIDYAVKMKKLDSDRQMDRLLANDLVTITDIRNLAKKIADFHKSAEILYRIDLMDIREKFNDLNSVQEILSEQSGNAFGKMIQDAIHFSDRYLEENRKGMAERLKMGFYRDCHGDLHSGNIFLLPEPVPFDCIEFNDSLRQIDVLNEVAFLCMDLDDFGHRDLSVTFLQFYNELFPVIKTEEDRCLFIYYKMYRANIRAKINALRAKTALTVSERTTSLEVSEKYLLQMKGYLDELDGAKIS